jgi:hypothetical protein
MHEDIELLNYIEMLGGAHRKEILVHPVIETFVTLRFLKYRRIATFNYFSFVFLFVVPFLYLIFFNHSKDGGCYWCHFGYEKFHYIGILFLIVRELLQMVTAERTIEYFKQRSNYFEMLLITVSVLVSVCSALHHEILTISESILILMTAVHATSLLTHKKAPIYFILLRKVTSIFATTFDIFLYVFLGLSLCFFITFESSKVEKTNEHTEANLEYFRWPFASFVRILTMLSGEYSLEVNDMSIFQLIFFFFFVLASFVLFNLIVGVSLDNIGEIIRESRQLHVLDRLERIVEMSEKFRRFYKRMG